MICGVDPGLSGAFVFLSEEGIIERIDLMPINAESLPDYKSILQILKEAKPKTILLERAVSFGMGLTGAFNYGQGFGIIRCAISQCDIPYSLIEPRKWTKEIYQGIDQNLKPKVQALIAIDRLFPIEKQKIPVSPKAKKLHEGVVDAVLIAEYGRRQYTGKL